MEEKRSLNFEVRQQNDGELMLSGYCNVTGKKSQQLSTFKEVTEKDKNGNESKVMKKIYFTEEIAEGTFDRAIRKARIEGREIPLLEGHKYSEVIATTKDKTLSLKEDYIGLKVESRVLPSKKKYYDKIKKGNFGMSFGMKVLKDKWIELRDGTFHRIVQAIELIEVTATENPAYKSSIIEARDLGSENIEYRYVGNIEEVRTKEISDIDKTLAKLRSRL